MTGPTVFISYSHQDEAWKDQLVRQLKVLELEGAYQLWDDRKIAAGEGWRGEIETAMRTARVAVLLISADFLISEFIRGTEVPRLLQRHAQEGVRIIPLIVRPCAWQGVEWLAAIQCRPKNARALSTKSRKAKVEEDLAALALEIRDLLPSPLSRGQGGREMGEGPGVRTHVPQTSPHLDLGRLPTPGPHFVGRDAELARLDAAWDDPRTHVLTLVAFGGVGKSALVARWLDRMAADSWRGAARALAWSFYSQGSNDQNTSAEPFIDHALRFFGDPDPKAGSLYDRGARLATLIRKERALLILDGIEPLQYPPGRPEVEGRLKDPGLTALLKGLAWDNPGLCVVTTRERIADLAGSPGTAPQVPLEELEPAAAVDLLRQLGVDGLERELFAAVEEFQRHALTLTLLGNFLRRAHKGDIRKRREIDLHKADEKQGGHAFRVIGAYAHWLGEGPELAVLRLLGLFDRPAEAGALKTLRAAPPIPGLTEPLVDLPEDDWHLATANLREHSLLLAADAREPETLDAHPLVRACFADELESHRPGAWQEGNRRLYEHLRQAAPDRPDTLEALQPLYAAIVHGCRAGSKQEAMDEIYKRRIQRGDEFYSTRKLGAFGSELTALAGFFDHPWSQPSARLTVADQAFVLNQTGFRLRALGRLAEAVEPMQAGLEARIALGACRFTRPRRKDPPPGMGSRVPPGESRRDDLDRGSRERGETDERLRVPPWAFWGLRGTPAHVCRLIYAICGGFHPLRNSFKRLCVAQISAHSAWTEPRPRSRNLRIPRASLICPKTGSTVSFRLEYTLLPVGVRNLAAIRSRVGAVSGIGSNGSPGEASCFGRLGGT